MHEIAAAIAGAQSLSALKSALEDAVQESTLSTESEATLANWDAAVTAGLTYNVEQVDETPTDPADDTSSTFSEPADLRRRREELGVSRRAVHEATGLSNSVVWRSESEKAKKISNDEWAKIDALYAKWSKEGVPAEYAKPVKTAKVAAHSGADQAEASRQLAALYQEFTEGLRTSISDKIAVAQSKKARTAELKALLAEVDEFLGLTRS